MSRLWGVQVRGDVARFVLEKAEVTEMDDLKAFVEDRVQAMEKETKRLSSIMFSTTNSSAYRDRVRASVL